MKRIESAGLVVGLAALWPLLVGSIALLGQIVRYRTAAHRQELP